MLNTNDTGMDSRRHSCHHCCLSHHDLKVTIWKHHSSLLNQIEPRYGLLETLLHHDVLTDEEFETMSKKTTTADMNRALLKFLHNSDDDKLQIFRNALEETRQHHVLHYLETDGNVTRQCSMRPLVSYELSRLKRCHLKLLELIDTSELLERLAADDCINEFQVNAIQLKKTIQKRNSLFLDIIKRRSYADFGRLIHWLSETHQKHLARLITEDMEIMSTSIRPLNDSELHKIKLNHQKVIAMMDVTELIDVLAAKDYITPRQRELIKGTASSIDQNEKLLDIFKRRSFADFMRFKRCLIITRQEHVAKLLYEDSDENPTTIQKSSNTTIESSLLGRNETRSTSCTQNVEKVFECAWHKDILELQLIKTAYVFTLNLWKTIPNPDCEVFTVLASVCYEWYDVMTARRWFERTLARRLSKFCLPFRRRIPRPTRQNTDGRAVTGVVEPGNYIYITCDESNVICAYTTYWPHTLAHSVSILEMKTPWDLAACTASGFLYIFDWFNKCVLQVMFDFTIQKDEDTSLKEKKSLYTVVKWENFTGRSCSLSVTRRGNVLIMDTLDGTLLIYSSCGDKLVVLSLLKYGMEWPEHVVETPKGTFIICHGTTPIQPHQVTEFDFANRRILQQFGSRRGNGPDNLSNPVRLAVTTENGYILLVDDNRVSLLSKSLEIKRVFCLRHFSNLNYANRYFPRMCYHKKTGQLFIVWENGYIHVYKIG